MAKSKPNDPNRDKQDRQDVEPTDSSEQPDDAVVEDDGYIPAGTNQDNGGGVSALFDSNEIASFDDPAGKEAGVVEDEADSSSILALFDRKDEDDQMDDIDGDASDDDTADDDDIADDELSQDDDDGVDSADDEDVEVDDEDEESADEAVKPGPSRPKQTKQSAAAATAKKQRPTRTRAQASVQDAPKRTTPGQFISQIVQELKKVSWPTSTQLLRYFLIVLVFVLFMILIITLLDVGFGRLMFALFG